MRGRAAQKIRSVGAFGGPQAGDYLRALLGAQRHKPLEEAGSFLGGGSPQHRRGEKYPDFCPRREFPHKLERAAFFPPHMSKGLVKMQKKLPQVDCIVEVRDARAPLTSSGCLAALRPTQNLQRLVVLNKCDLVSCSEAKKAQALIQAAGLECVLTSAKDLQGVQRITNWLLQLPVPKFDSIGRWMMMAGLPNTGKSSVLNALKRLAYSAGYYGRQGNQLVAGVKRTPAKTGKLPGVTKEIQSFQITNKPRVYCLDSPGILLPKQCDAESCVRLGLLGILPERLIGEEIVADFLLFNLNRHRKFEYVEALGLECPTNDVHEVSRHICLTLGRRSERMSLPPIDLQKGFLFFLNLFRGGHFGSLCLDDLPSPDALQKRRDILHLQR